MKNKEIEELLNKLKECRDDDELFLIKQHSANLLLSYIEQLEKELKEEQEDNYKQSQLLVDKQQKIEQLENDRDKAIKKCQDKQYQTNHEWLKRFAKEIENILKGDSE